MKFIDAAEFKNYIGKELGASEWFQIDQDRINAFADATLDHQFIHVDEDRAKAETPFGGTIAHGFLTLSILSHLNSTILPEIEGRVMTFNYGMNKVRFLNPVKSGARVRSRVVLDSVEDKPGNRILCQFKTVVEIEGEETPALMAEQLAMHVLA